ncbi:hypothetical protein Asulf_01760 [Archaeoglobus sulfaticallidus PM70-1]|uniref:DUF4157 domain-containing protein n=1 Tax=Archaeoglobus sulfaticallidus PM70-1 TaxID=387631 RepID=N0BM86_9EURY|nr:hypothetical protein [Archaeoglobus sulfaticallidus]AGK61731.1 hypothetical protein Asulf_01760 [Archaeoglobus sulfaticallidus PM70-1]
MEKSAARRLAIILLISFTAFLLSTYTVHDVYQERTIKIYDEVRHTMEEIRHKKIDVPVKVVDMEWVLERWGSSTVSEEEAKKEEMFYKSLLIVPSNFSFKRKVDSEVAGFMAFYWKDAVYVVRENFDPYSNSGKEALAHELEHAIQDRYFTIKAGDTHDGEKAYSALIEGSAVIAGWLYVNKSIEKELSKIENETECKFEINRGFDDSLHLLYFFPYKFGTLYAGKMYLETGDLDNGYLNPPKSTKEILEGKKSFIKVVGNWDVEGYDLIRNDTLGEFFTYIFLSTHLSDCEALESAKGWNGDNFKLFRLNNSFVFFWKICFETEKDADEFQNSITQLLNTVGVKKGDYWETGLKGTINEIIKFKRNGREILIEGMGKI